MNDQLALVLQELEKRNCLPLYVVRFGSFLYGTNSETSDTDFKVVYLPSKRDMLLGKQMNHFEFSTGKENERNTVTDVDVSCKSLHTFLRDLSKGETGALDVAFSFTNSDAVLFKNPVMDVFFENVEKFFNVKNMSAFFGYANSQAVRYSLKGERFTLVNDMVAFLKENKESLKNLPLGYFMGELDEKFHNDAMCFVTKKEQTSFCDRQKAFFHVLNADYMATLPYENFLACLVEKLNRFGARTRKCADDKVDWKALSHAVRCVDECKELVETGMVHFPLKTREYVKAVKYGHLEFDDVLATLENGLKEVGNLMKSATLKNTYDENFVDNFVLMCFEEN